MNIEVLNLNQPVPFDFHVTKVFVQGYIDLIGSAVNTPVSEGDPWGAFIGDPISDMQVFAGSTLLTLGTDYLWAPASMVPPVGTLFHLITTQTEPITATFTYAKSSSPCSVNLYMDFTVHDIWNDYYGNPIMVTPIQGEFGVQRRGIDSSVVEEGDGGIVRGNILVNLDITAGQSITIENQILDRPGTLTSFSYAVMGYRI